MSTNDWNWAKLDGDKIKALNEVEGFLGDEHILLAYQPVKQTSTLPPKVQVVDYTFANLNPGQLDRLKKLEQQIGSVIVAYTYVA
jgi:hypothetical protein